MKKSWRGNEVSWMSDGSKDMGEIGVIVAVAMVPHKIVVFLSMDVS